MMVRVIIHYHTSMCRLPENFANKRIISNSNLSKKFEVPKIKKPGGTSLNESDLIKIS